MDTVRLRIHVIEQADFYKAQKDSGSDNPKVSSCVSPNCPGFRLKLTSQGGDSICAFSAEVKKRFESVMNVSSSLYGLYDDFFYYLNPDDTVQGLLQMDDLCYLVVKDIRAQPSAGSPAKRNQETGATPPAKRAANDKSVAPSVASDATGPASSTKPASIPTKTGRPRGRPRKKQPETTPAQEPAEAQPSVEEPSPPQVINETQEHPQASARPSRSKSGESRVKSSASEAAQLASRAREARRTRSTARKSKLPAAEVLPEIAQAENSIIPASPTGEISEVQRTEEVTNGATESSRDANLQRDATLDAISPSQVSSDVHPSNETAATDDSLPPVTGSQSLASPQLLSSQLFGEDRALTDRAVSEDKDYSPGTTGQQNDSSPAFNLLKRQRPRKLHPDEFGAADSSSKPAVGGPSPVKPIRDRTPSDERFDRSSAASAGPSETFIASDQEEVNSEGPHDAENNPTGSDSEGDDDSEAEEEEIRRRNRLQRAKAVSASRKNSVLGALSTKSSPVRATRQSTQKETRQISEKGNSETSKQLKAPDSPSAQNGSDTISSKKAGNKAFDSVPGLGGFAALSKVRPTVHDSATRPKRYEILDDTQSSDEESDSDSSDYEGSEASASDNSEAGEEETPRRKRGGALNSLRKL